MFHQNFLLQLKQRRVIVFVFVYQEGFFKSCKALWVMLLISTSQVSYPISKSHVNYIATCLQQMPHNSKPFFKEYYDIFQEKIVQQHGLWNSNINSTQTHSLLLFKHLSKMPFFCHVSKVKSHYSGVGLNNYFNITFYCVSKMSKLQKLSWQSH